MKKTMIVLSLLLGSSIAFAKSNDDIATALGKADFEQVKKLQKKGQKIDAVSSEGTTGLMKLAEDGNSFAVRQALKLGAKIDAKNERGETALWYAVYAGHEALALELLAKGAKPDGVLKETNECLVHYAAKAQLAKLSAKLKTATPKCLSIKNTDGQTPADIATSFGDEALAKTLKP